MCDGGRPSSLPDDAATMAGLIPLALGSASASVCAPPRRPSVRFATDSQQQQRLMSRSRPSSMPPHFNSRPCPSLKPRPVSMTALTMPPPPRAPATAAEWKAALADIKKSYMDSKYTQCLDRCHELLASTEVLESDQAIATYLVYLRFYAAAALEAQARSVHHSSRHRVALLRKAQVHYRRADELAGQADDAASLPSSRIASPMPSLHSSADSDVSCSSASTRMSSPTPSLCLPADGLKSPERAPSRPRKRVTFRNVPIMEPIVRPDSPTLGFDDCLSPTFPRALHTPEPPVEMPSPVPPPELARDDEPADPFFHVRAIHRYCTVLSTIRALITARLADVDAEIAACHAPAPVAATSDELRALDVRARIERLRANGWRRPRFDAQRYELLRERALADLMA